MLVISIIIAIIILILFLPIKLHIAYSSEKDDEKKLEIRIIGIKVYKKRFSQIFNKKKKPKHLKNADISKILKTLKYKKVFLKYCVNTEDYICNVYINNIIMTFVNMYLSFRQKNIEKAEIDIKYEYTKEPYLIDFSCIAKTNIANNIGNIVEIILRIIKERWNNKCQNIQLKV